MSLIILLAYLLTMLLQPLLITTMRVIVVVSMASVIVVNMPVTTPGTINPMIFNYPLGHSIGMHNSTADSLIETSLPDLSHATTQWQVAKAKQSSNLNSPKSAGLSRQFSSSNNPIYFEQHPNSVRIPSPDHSAKIHFN